MRTHVVHWGDIAPKLPFGSDSVTKMKRRELFEACDPRGIGLLSQAEVVRYYFRLLPPIGGVVDIRVVLNLCFRVARDTVTPVVHIGSQQLDRNQFRVFLMSIWYYIKLWEHFCTVDATSERIVTLDNFMRVLPAMVEWGFGEVDQWLADPEPVFPRLDRSGSGEVAFDELAEFCLRHGLPKLSAPEDEEERKVALDVLSRTQPHLASKVAPDMGSHKYRGSVPPVPPPGQKLPPSGPSSTSSSPSCADSKMKRWSSQYMVDYLPPSRRSSRPGSAAVSAVPTPSRSTRSSTPAGNRRDGERAASKDLRRQTSVPSIAPPAGHGDPRAGELDRNALRSKLEQNVQMYNTNQMRRVLEAAGNMVVGPRS